MPPSRPDQDTDAPLVDIGIPVFRRSAFVAEAIESVLTQSYEHWRLTISEEDGPSEQVTAAVQPYLNDARIHYVPQRARLGVARHKSRLSDGTGEYLAVLDDDDRWLDGWLERRVKALQRHPACVLAWGGHVDIDPTGVELARPAFPLDAGIHSSAVFTHAMMRANVVATPSVLVRRSAYERAGNSYDATFTHINDYELWLRLGLLGPVVFLGVHDSCYRLHQSQMSRRHDRALDHLQLVDHLDALLCEHLPELRLSVSARRRKRADGLVSAALDAAGEHERRLAARRIAAAARLDPRALGSKRAVAAVAATLAGRRVRERLNARRT
jgi:glycosyltransferase involved in cell wall biosynthesis